MLGSVLLTLGGLLLLLLSLLIHDRLHGQAGSLWPRTETYRQTKLYAKCLSLTIVVLAELIPIEFHFMMSQS